MAIQFVQGQFVDHYEPTIENSKSVEKARTNYKERHLLAGWVEMTVLASIVSQTTEADVNEAVSA